MKANIKTILLFLAATFSAIGCYEETNETPDNNQEVAPIALISRSELRDWDDGYLLMDSIAVYIKAQEDSTHFCYFKQLYDVENNGNCIVEFDTDFRVSMIITNNKHYHYLYTSDFIYEFSYSKDSDNAVIQKYPIQESKIMNNLSCDNVIQTKVAPIVIYGAAKLISPVVDAVTQVVDMSIDAKRFGCINSIKMHKDEIKRTTTITILAKRGIPGTGDAYSIYSAASGVYKLKNKLQTLEFEYGYLGNAGAVVSSFNEHGISVILREGRTLPAASKGYEILCGVVIKYAGLDPSTNVTPTISSHDFHDWHKIDGNTPVLYFNVPNMKLGCYVATPYIWCQGLVRYGPSEKFYYSVFELPTYNVTNYAFYSTGPGILSANITAEANFIRNDFSAQNIYLRTKRGAELFHFYTNSEHRSYIAGTINNSMNIRDLDVNFSSYSATLSIESEYRYIISKSGVNSSKLKTTRLNYSTKPRISFSIPTIHTEARVEQRPGTKSSNPDEPDEIIYYQTRFSIPYEIQGSFWIQSARVVKNSPLKIAMSSIKTHPDGKYVLEGMFEYTSDYISPYAYISCDLQLINGVTIPGAMIKLL